MDRKPKDNPLMIKGLKFQHDNTKSSKSLRKKYDPDSLLNSPNVIPEAGELKSPVGNDSQAQSSVHTVRKSIFRSYNHQKIDYLDKSEIEDGLLP